MKFGFSAFFIVIRTRLRVGMMIIKENSFSNFKINNEMIGIAFVYDYIIPGGK